MFPKPLIAPPDEVANAAPHSADVIEPLILGEYDLTHISSLALIDENVFVLVVSGDPCEIPFFVNSNIVPPLAVKVVVLPAQTELGVSVGVLGLLNTVMPPLALLVTLPQEFVAMQ